MMGQVYAQFASEQAITVHFNPDTFATGRIVWSRDQRIGVEFDSEVDVDAILSAFGKQYEGKKLNRAPRLQIDCSGELLILDKSVTVNVQDISQRGVKVATSILSPGEEVTIRLPDMKQKKAIVRWVQEGTCGLNFLVPLGFEELARWVIERQSLAA